MATNQELEVYDFSVNGQLKKIEEQNEQILEILDKKRKKKKKVDENEERGNWSGQMDFFLSCLGYAVGLGNVWRFPYICYKNGGGAFLIPYTLMLIFLGMPIFFLELSLGQFTSRGPLSCWNFAPIFAGLGYAMCIVSAIIAIYYNIIIGWAIYYLFDSFRSELPWAKCDPAWSTPNCMDNLPLFTVQECHGNNYTVNASMGICTNGTARAIFNKTLAATFGIVRTLPSEEYLDRHVLHKSESIEDLGSLQTPLVMCYLVGFIFVIVSLNKSIKSSGKVVYFTATFPYLVLIILLIRGLFLEGADKGISFYTKPDLSKLADSAVWKEAAVQIFFSLSASYGGLIALSSYNKFHTNTFRDSLAVCLCNCLTSVFAGFVIFSYLGNLATNLGKEVDEVADQAITLAFVVYPYAVTQMPGSPVWAILFFFMLLTLGVDSEFVLVETVLTCLNDTFPKLRKYKLLTVTICCMIMFLLGLTLTTSGGLYMLVWMDSYSAGWNLLFTALLECLAIGYVYGAKRFLKDIECMIGKRVFWDTVPWDIMQWWWAACWCVMTPLGLTFIIIYSWWDYQSLESQGFSGRGDVLGWLLTVVILLTMAGNVVYLVGFKGEGTLLERFKKASAPLPSWGPDLPQHRALVEGYTCSFNKGDSQRSDRNNGDVPTPVNMVELGIQNRAYDNEREITEQKIDDNENKPQDQTVVNETETSQEDTTPSEEKPAE